MREDLKIINEIEIIEENGFRYYNYIGDPNKFKLIAIIEKYAIQQLEVKLTRSQKKVIVSLLLTLRSMQKVHEQNTKYDRPTEIKVPRSQRDYTNNRKAITYCLPKIKGIGLTTINKCVWVLGKNKGLDRSNSFTKNGLAIIELINGVAYGKHEKPKYRRIYLRPVEEWNIWNKTLLNEQDLFNTWSGYLELSSPLGCDVTTNSIKEYKHKYGAVIMEKDSQLLGPAPVTKRLEISTINCGFPSYMKEYSYSRSFRDSTLFIGRLNGAFTFIPRKIRNILLNRLDLVEIDIKNCATNILHTMTTGDFHAYDFYEKYATVVSHNIQSSLSCKRSSIFHSAENILHQSWRQVFKGIVTRSIGAVNEEQGIKAIKGFLQEIGLYHQESDEEYATRVNLNKWKKFRTSNRDYDAPMYVIPFTSLIESLKLLTSKSFKDLLFNNISYVTMNVESNALVRVLTEMIEDNQLPLACHDAVFVNKDYYKKYFTLFPEFIKEEALKRASLV